jgi:protein-tyrosine phosphatase
MPNLDVSGRPITQCYWVVPGKLLAGEYPRDKEEATSQEKINALLDAGVSVFVDLTEEHEGLRSYTSLIGKAIHRRFAIRDVAVPDSPETTIQILDTIDRYIQQGEMVYVHCWGGVGRTGVIIGCWLARHDHGGEAALIRLRKLWTQCPKSATHESPETRDQERYIQSWQV